MKLPQLKPREFRFIAATLIVAFLTLNQFAVVPWWKKNREESAKLAADKDKEKRFQEALSHAAEWKQKLNALTQEKATNAAHVESDLAWLKYLQGDLADNVGIKLEATASNKKSGSKGNKSDTPGSENSSVMRVHCSVTEANFEKITKLLHLLTTDTARPQIDRCKLTSEKAGEDKIRAELDVSVVLKPAKKTS